MSKLLNWRRRADKTEDAVTPSEPVAPITPTPEPENPAAPEVKRSFIPAVNYLRAFLILKKIPFKQLRAEFLKLPLRQIAWVIGIGIWAYMTYALAMWVFVK